ncbi:hypothetical protein D3C71_1720440 [compost metagenome]
MRAFLIDPLKVGDRVITQVDIDDSVGGGGLHPQLCALLCLDPGSTLERLDVGPEDWGCELVVAGAANRPSVRHLGEFRIMKSGGDYVSLPGRGVILGYEGAASQLMGILASSGMWVSA